MDAEATVRAYYAALDDGRYDDLRDVLAPGFTQRRPDRTFDDRDAFLSFMTTDRPHEDTTHVLDGVFVPDADRSTNRLHRTTSDDAQAANDDDATAPTAADATATTASDESRTILARGTVERDTGDVVVAFVDSFDVLADRIVALDTYTR